MILENEAMSTREEDKPSVLLRLADCGSRDGLTEQQQTSLNGLRLTLAYAFQGNDKRLIAQAKSDLLGFYEQLPEVKNGDNVMTAGQAMASDALRLQKAAKEYDPNYDHPDYRGGP